MKQTKNKMMKNVAIAIATICSVQFSLTGMASAQTVNSATTYSAVAKAYSEKLQADKPVITVSPGDTYTIELTYNGRTLDNAKVDWSVTNSSIAAVKNGGILGKRSGTVIITASYNDEEVYILLNVTKVDILEANSSTISLKKGNEKTITLKYNNKSISGTSATWTTSNTDVATVKNGVVTGKSAGTAVITARYNGQTVRVTVNVDSNASGKLDVVDTEISMKKGEKETITLFYDGSKLTGSKAIWNTSKAAVATVNDGVITAKGKGTATITAEYKGYEVEIEVKVDDKDSQKLAVVDSEISMRKGEKETVTLFYDGSKLAGSKATWNTSKAAVATVTDGVITAKGKGTATITAEYKGYEVEIEVKVDDKDSKKLAVVDSEISMRKGEKETVTLFYDGSKLAGSKATWNTSKAAVATVTDGVITAKGEGTATIKAEYKDEKVEIEVKVEEKNSKMLEADETKVNLKKGKKETIKLKYDGRSISGSKATWKTSKSSVATVDDDGVITAKAKGTATITASYKSESVKIEVNVDTTGSSDTLEASKTKLSLDKGDKATIKLTYDGSSLSGTKASWSTSKSSVATVSSSGEVTAKAKGTATITAKYKGGEVEIEVNVDTDGSGSDSLEADDTSISIKKGDTETIGLTYNNKSISNSKATWTTSKSSVATVNRGVVKGKAKGTATITAEYKGEKVKIKVTVK
ncbi:Ig-like domain-containing protein [Brevibacillus sp. NRS-1366]|uniref:Ig-like domain-containing protein n=1 Tax=Brevibacillus sp. NRS-1366 TaxID=3233899 RepID=UPI003D23DADB